MVLRTPRPTGRPGAAAVEFALLSPLIVALLLGVWEVGRLIQVNQILSNAAREGGRQASTGLMTNAQVQTAVLQYLQRAGLPTTNATVTVTNLTNSSLDATAANQLDQFRITVTLPAADVKWVALSLVTNSSSTLSATVVWYSLRDQDYPSNITPPSGS
jgi:Flp pilus assembly protein TadG